jgi:hypothetical protein
MATLISRTAPGPTVIVNGVGLDLGQQQDFSALVQIYRERRWSLSGIEEPSLIAVVNGKRWPRGTTYDVVAKDVIPLAHQLTFTNGKITVDNSGVGRAFVDFCRAQGCKNIVAVTATGGTSERLVKKSSKGEDWNIAKVVMYRALAKQVHLGLLKVPRRSLFKPWIGQLLAELKQIDVKASAQGLESYSFSDSAEVDGHGDYVSALALSCWEVMRPPPPKAYIVDMSWLQNR